MNVGSVDEFHAEAIDAVASVTLQMLENTFHEINYHLDILHATNGNHIKTHENFLSCSFNHCKLFFSMFCSLCFRNFCDVVKTS
jgi:hypothetical protein